MKAIQALTPGGSSALALHDVPKPQPGRGEALIEIVASGVNFIDIYVREGRYGPPFPLIPGQEAAGIVVAVGEAVTEVTPGDRVAWCSVLGTYAEYAVAPAARLVKVPHPLSLTAAAAVLLQGMTAHYLTKSLYRIQRGDEVLVHAGAGGVGLLLTQMSKALGAIVTTTVSSEAKAELSRKAGASRVILNGETANLNPYSELYGKMHVAYDSIGLATFHESIRCLRDRGTAVLYGSASGPVPPFDLEELARGSYFVSRPILKHYTATSEELRWRASDVFQAVVEGRLSVLIGKTYTLSEAPMAQLDLESRRSTGKLILQIRSE